MLHSFGSLCVFSVLVTDAVFVSGLRKFLFFLRQISLRMMVACVLPARCTYHWCALDQLSYITLRVSFGVFGPKQLTHVSL